MSAPIERACECLDLHTNNLKKKIDNSRNKAPCLAVKNILWLNIFYFISFTRVYSCACQVLSPHCCSMLEMPQPSYHHVKGHRCLAAHIPFNSPWSFLMLYFTDAGGGDTRLWGTPQLNIYPVNETERSLYAFRRNLLGFTVLYGPVITPLTWHH